MLPRVMHLSLPSDAPALASGSEFPSATDWYAPPHGLLAAMDALRQLIVDKFGEAE